MVCQHPGQWLWNPMPRKFDQPRRHKIPRARYRMTNWPEYDAALVWRGHLTVCSPTRSWQCGTRRRADCAAVNRCIPHHDRNRTGASPCAPPAASPDRGCVALDRRPARRSASQRDQHRQPIAEHERVNWQRSSGYCRHSLVETAMYRYKTIVGRRLHPRTLPNQRTEAKTGCNVLNRMTRLGIPISVRIE
jgi:hypothetical protein